MSRIVYCTSAIALLLCSSGCIQETTEGTTHTFTYEWWVPTLALVGGLIAVPLGWILRQSSARFGWGLLIVGPIAALGFAPSLFRDRAVVDDNSFSLRSGIWGMTAVHDVKIDDLNRIRLTVEETTGRRGRKRKNFYLVCERKDGTSAKVPVNNNIAEAAAPQFLENVAKRGIPLVDET